MTGEPENKPRTSGDEFIAWRGADSRIRGLCGKLCVEWADSVGVSWRGDVPICRSIWALIADEKGRRVVVCLDGRGESPTRYRMFEGARWPGDVSAVLVGLGSSDEDLIIATLSGWCDSEGFARHYRAEFKAALQEALLRLRLLDPDDITVET
jgi:hypothetical protein